MILAPDAQEISHLTCDLGYDADAVRSQAPDLIAKAAPLYDSTNLDTTLVDGLWNSKVSEYMISLKRISILTNFNSKENMRLH